MGKHLPKNVKSNDIIEFKETWSPKAISVMRKAIKLSGENVHSKYNLFNITSHLVEIVPIKTKRDVLKLNYTGEIMRCIDWMVKNNLI